MTQKTLIIWIMGIILLCSFTNAFTISNVTLYYNTNETGETAIDNKNLLNGTYANSTYGQGIINGTHFYTGNTNSNMQTGTPPHPSNTLGNSWSFWIYPNASQSKALITARGSGYDYAIYQVSNALRLEMGAGGNPTYITNSSALTINAWNHVVLVYTDNATLPDFYVNGVKYNTTLSGTVANFGTNANVINFAVTRVGTTNYDAYLGAIDEVAIFYGYKLNQTEVNTLYNSGLGLEYPFIQTPTIPPIISFVNQTPTDITATTLLTQNINITYNYNNTILTNPRLNYTLTSNALPCIQWINGTCTLLNNTYTSIAPISNNTNGSFTNYSWTLNENNAYPSISLLNTSTYATTHTNLSLINSNQYLTTEFYNLSLNNSNILLELMTTSTGISRIYICNDSYNYGTTIDSNINCQEVGNINVTTYNHTHGTFGSGHNIIPFTISNQRIGGTGITLTPKIIVGIRGSNSATTNIGHIPNTTREGTTRTTTNNWISYSNQTYTIDSHIHQYDTGGVYLNYYAYGTFGADTNITSTTSELIDLTALPPTPSIITTPFNTVQSTQFINITYTNATVNTAGAQIRHYNISLLNNDLTFNRTIIANNSLNNSYNYNLYAQNLSLGIYYVRVTAYDTAGFTASDEEYFNLTRNTLLNISSYDATTGASITNFSVNITGYNDNILTSNSTIVGKVTFDVIRGNTYSIYFDAPAYAVTTINYTAQDNITQLLNQTLYKTNSVLINIYDESSLAYITNVTTGLNTNITFVSNESSVMYNASNGTIFLVNLTPNIYEVIFNAPLYSQRSYFITVTNRSTQTLNAFLTQSATNVLFTYQDRETGVLLEGVGVTVYKIINGSWQAVANGFTDITGRVQFTVSTNTNYRFTSTISGYEDKTFNLNPVIFTSYTVQLTKISVSTNQLTLTDVDVYYTGTTFRNSIDNTFDWWISAPSGNLESFGYNLTTACKNITSFSGVNAYGDSDSVTFNLSCASISDTVNLRSYYTLSNGTQTVISRTFSIYGNGTIPNIAKNVGNTYGMDLFTRTLIALLITIAMAGFVTMYTNIIAGLGAGMLVLGYVAYIGFIPFWLIVPSLIVGFIILTSWSRRS